MIKLVSIEGFKQKDLIKDEKETLIQRILKFANWWYSNPETHFVGCSDRMITCFNEAYDNTVKFNPGVNFSLVEIEKVRSRFHKNIIHR